MTGLGSSFYHLVYQLNSAPVVPIEKCQHLFPSHTTSHPTNGSRVCLAIWCDHSSSDQNINYKPNLKCPSSPIQKSDEVRRDEKGARFITIDSLLVFQCHGKMSITVCKEHLAQFKLFCFQFLWEKKSTTKDKQLEIDGVQRVSAEWEAFITAP